MSGGAQDGRDPREVCREIAADTEHDAKNFDGQPFNGRTVAEYFGNQGAAIAALALIIERLLECQRAVTETITNEKARSTLEDAIRDDFEIDAGSFGPVPFPLPRWFIHVHNNGESHDAKTCDQELRGTMHGSCGGWPVKVHDAEECARRINDGISNGEFPRRLGAHPLVAGRPEMKRIKVPFVVAATVIGAGQGFLFSYLLPAPYGWLAALVGGLVFGIVLVWVYDRLEWRP